MPKPANAFTWATDADYAAGSDPWSGTPTKTSPIPGLIASGWTPTEHPTAQNVNHMFHSIGEWIAYLDSGDFEGNVTIDGTLTIARSVPGFASAITADGVVAATDFRYTTQRSRHLPAAAANPGAGHSWDDVLWRWQLGTSTNALICPIDVAVGDRVHSWLALAVKPTASGTITARLVAHNINLGTITTIGSDQTNSSVNPGNIALGESGLTYDVPGDTAIAIVVIGSGVNGDSVRGFEINTSRP